MKPTCRQNTQIVASYNNINNLLADRQAPLKHLVANNKNKIKYLMWRTWIQGNQIVAKYSD